MIKAKRVLLRCDASESIGLGHLSRCLNLADSLVQYNIQSTIAIAAPSSRHEEMIAKRGHTIHCLEKSEALDLDVVRRVAVELVADWVVIDNYGLSANPLERVINEKWRLCVIDDLEQQDFLGTDLVVRPYLGAHEASKSCRSPRMLVGPKYALLHRVFADLRPASRARDRKAGLPQKVLISMGGADTSHISEEVLEGVLEVLPSAQVRIVLGASEERFEREESNVEILGLLSPERLAEAMVWSDFAVASPSTISWELATLDVPAVYVLTADNQSRNAAALDAIGESVIRSVCELPSAMRRVLRREPPSKRECLLSTLFDGRGAARVAEKLALLRNRNGDISSSK